MTSKKITKEKKKKQLFEEIELTPGVDANVNNDIITVRNGNKEVTRKIIQPIIVEVKDNKINVTSKKSTKRERKIFGTMNAHIRNMIKGVTIGFKYRLQIASVHFPITTKIDNEKNELAVKNFLGEKKDRIIKLLPGVEVKVNKDIIEIESADIEKAGQIASNLEKGTKIRLRDRRIFQDGIYIIEKPGRSFL